MLISAVPVIGADSAINSRASKALTKLLLLGQTARVEEKAWFMLLVSHNTDQSVHLRFKKTRVTDILDILRHRCSLLLPAGVRFSGSWQYSSSHRLHGRTPRTRRRSPYTCSPLRWMSWANSQRLPSYTAAELLRSGR